MKGSERYHLWINTHLPFRRPSRDKKSEGPLFSGRAFLRIVRICFASILLFLFIQQSLAVSSLAREKIDSSLGIKKEQLAPIAEIVKGSIRSGKIPGAVILIGSNEKIVYRQAFGYRSLVPRKAPMTVDTLFDLASLTKVIATTTAVLQLVEEGSLHLDDPVSKFWPEFVGNGKDGITIHDLLTHTSGFRPDLDQKSARTGYEAVLREIEAETPLCPPGAKVIYSDINYEILGELVSRISGQSLDAYCDEHIFKPLGMKNTCFNPSPALRERIAPTQYEHETVGRMLCGEVHDPTALRMGGVAGHAGLFSTADDLSIFAQMLLEYGEYKGVRILSRVMVEKMTSPQTPAGKLTPRGLGWEIGSPLDSARGESSYTGSYSHTGFTGTSIWIDPASGTYVIILTNRVHPKGKGNVRPLRSKIAKLVASALEQTSVDKVSSVRTFSLNMKTVIEDPPPGQDLSNGRVRTGIDVLKAERFASFKGLRVGLITNHSGLDSSGQPTIDLFHKARSVSLRAIFTPEHGLTGTKDEPIPSSIEHVSRIPIYSLYGKTYRPTDKMLKGLDGLVFDIQDAGVRFYTYISTMGYAMEAAAKKGIPFYVLDRPNPITASCVQGPVSEDGLKSFTSYWPLPVRHGMTVGELARMFNAEMKLGVKLKVIRMEGYKRTDWYDETGLRWISPSPNLRSLTEAVLYPGVAMVEGANVSVGRGTETPFELLGAPWIEGEELAHFLNERDIHGVRFEVGNFMPTAPPYKNQSLQGIRIILVDRQALDSASLGVELISALCKLYPKDFQIDKTIGLVGSREVLQSIKDGQDPVSIKENWQIPLEKFIELRSKYLLY